MRQQAYIQQHFRRGNAESSVNQDEKGRRWREEGWA